MRNLGSILRLEYGAALPSAVRTNFGYPVYGSNGIVGYHHEALVQEPGSVVGRKGSVGKVLWSETKFWPIDTTYYVISQCSNKKWLHWLLAWLPLESLDTSTGVPGLNRNDVYRLNVFYPSVGEQRLIADILDTLDTQIRRTEEIIAKLEQVKQGLLTDLLTRGIDENGELRPSPEEAPELYKDSPLGRIPSNWEVGRLGDIISRHGGLIQTGPFGSQLHAYEYVNHGIPVVMPQDMRGVEISEENVARITPDRAQELKRHRTQFNDLLIARRGDVSRCSFIGAHNEGAICGTGCLLVRLPSDVVNGYWLAHAYKQPWVQKQVLGMAVGSTMINVNASILANIRIPTPPMNEQNEFERRIRELKRRIDIEETNKAKLFVQKTGLMDDLLTGRLRVTPLLKQAEKATV